MLLLRSGGCDSTYVLAERLKAKEPVRTISIVHPQFNLNAEQKHARKLVVEHFKRKKITWPHLDFEISRRHPFGYRHNVQMGGCLPGIWIGIAAAHLEQAEDLGIAYIKGDNAIHWLESIRGAFASLQSLSWRTGKLELPVEWLSKAQIIAGLKRHRLLGKTWWCENPNNGRKCGKCSPCMTHKTAEWVLASRNDFKLHGDWADANQEKTEVEHGQEKLPL